MDTTTIVALILVVAGPIALYFLRRGNVRSNGQFVELADYIKQPNETLFKQTDDEPCDLFYDSTYSSLSCNIYHSD